MSSSKLVFYDDDGEMELSSFVLEGRKVRISIEGDGYQSIELDFDECYDFARDLVEKANIIETKFYEKMEEDEKVQL